MFYDACVYGTRIRFGFLNLPTVKEKFLMTMKPHLCIPFCDRKTDECTSRWTLFNEKMESTGAAVPTNLASMLEQAVMLSDFIYNTAIRTPDIIKDLIESDDISISYGSGAIEATEIAYTKRLKNIIRGISDEPGLMKTLREFRSREMVRIAARDLTDAVSLFETLTDLSVMADVIINETLRIIYAWAIEKHGTPRSHRGEPQEMAVLGLGKLGGHELNFSSDVDLIFTYPEPGITDGEKQVTNEQFFTKLGRTLVKMLGENTKDGIVFRTDMRLRPYGASGPLVMHFDEMETYYQDQGREWERYALIKARPVAGDKTAGYRLLDILSPFVFRRYLDFSAFESLRDMKRRINLEVRKTGMKDNIKLGPGGIREIEFFGQMFQLVRGGVLSDLKYRSIIKVLDVLKSENIVAGDVTDGLKSAYEFLRNTEHRIQMLKDQQTHSIPKEACDRLRVAVGMGFGNFNDFKDALNDVTLFVHKHFSRLMEADKNDAEINSHKTGKLKESRLGELWFQEELTEQGEKTLLDNGFSQPREVFRLLEYIKASPETRMMSREGRTLLDKIMPKVLKKTGPLEESHIVLNRIIELFITIERRTCYLSLLLENPDALTHLIHLCSKSPWISSFLTRHPVLLDELLDPRTLYSPPKRAELSKDLERKIARIPDDDLEYQMEALRIFKQAAVFRVAAADVTGSLHIMKVSDRLTDIAEVVLAEVLRLSYDHLTKKHGFPECELNGDECGIGFAVIAYGKLGGYELGYGSDLDLVFLHTGKSGKMTGGRIPLENTQFFIRLAQRVIHFLTAMTPAGILYEADMRLRPSGSSGTLVCHVDSFRDYQVNDSWTWEKQALVRARPILGDDRILKRFKEIQFQVLSTERDDAALKKEVADMRSRLYKENIKPNQRHFDLKHSKGGIVDIEFLVQYLVLKNAHKHPAVLDWPDNVRILETFEDEGILDAEAAVCLRDAYLAYRFRIHQLSLQEKPSKVNPQDFSILTEKVNCLWEKVFECA